MTPELVLKAAGLIKTGKTYALGKDDKRFNSGEPGVGVEGAKYSLARAWSRSAPTLGGSK